MQPEQAMEQSGCHLSRCLMASCSPQREQPGWLACKHVVFIDIFSTSSHYLWVEVVTFCGPGLEATTAMQQRGKGRSRGREGFTNDSVYWLRRCLAGILHGSLRAPLSILPPFILGPPPREQLVSIRGTLSCLPNISRAHRLAEKILTWPFMPMRAHRLTVHLTLSENGELPHHVPEVARQLSLPYVTFKCLPEMPYMERSQKVYVGATKLLCTEVFAEAIITDSMLSEATRIIPHILLGRRLHTISRASFSMCKGSAWNLILCN